MESNQNKSSKSCQIDSEIKIPLSRRLTRSLRHKLAIVFLSVLIYLVSFISISYMYGKGGPTAAFFPVVVVGWLFGFLPGLFAGLLALPVNLLTGFLMGASLSEQLEGGGISGIVVIMLMGMVVGRYRDLTLRLKKELTERHRAESDLTESKEQLDKLIDTSLDPIVITDENSVIVRPNRAFLEMVEYDQNEILGLTIYDLGVKTEGSYESTTGETIKITSQYFETDLLSAQEKLYRDGKISNWQNYFINKSGKVIPVTQNIVFSYNEKNECISKFGIIHDVTEQRKTELELVASREAAVEANNFRSRFFTNITHEFRTPLTLATGPVEEILRGESGEISLEIRQQLEVVLKSSRQLLRLVNQLLDFSMLEAGAENVILENKNIVQFVSAVMDSFSLAAKKKNIRLDFNAAENMPVYAVDSGKLEKILYNLFGNAFKYTPKGGTISVAITDEESFTLDPEETLVTAVAEGMVP